MENDDNKIMAKKNPWLGLQSYSEEETIYGRDNDIQELTQCVLGDKETLLYGKSGIGKSSILNAGVIPTSIRKGFLPVPVRLDHKKDESYLSQISAEIAFQMAKRYGDTNAKGIVEVLKPKREEEEESFYEYFHRHKFLHPSGERVKLLIILDQFEEIFTLQDKESVKKQFFAEMADFLNDIMPEYLREEEEIVESNEQKSIELKSEKDLDDIFGDIQLSIEQHAPKFVTDNEVHIVFTIREDFLSEFEYYTATIPALKHNRYGLRPLNEEQAAQIILRPMPGLVTLSVAKLIIEKVTNKKDFDIDGVPEIEVDSAVLSLYMNRLYEEKTGDTITAELVEEKGQGIIKQFYYDVIKDIDPEKVEFLEENLLNSQNRRENVTEYDILNEGHFTKKELKELCEGKNMILRKFYLSGDMRIEFIHDILCPVIKEHKEERIKLQQEEAERIKQDEEKRRFVEAEKAKREKIEREAQIEQERLKEEANKNKARMRRIITLFIVLGLLVTTSIAWYHYKVLHIYSSYYYTYELKNGLPVGIGKLSEYDIYKTPLYYKLSHKGYGKPDTDVEVMSSNSELPKNIIRIPCIEVANGEHDINAQKFRKKLSKVKTIHFEIGERGKINKEVIKDEFGNVLYYVNYFHLDADGMAWAQYLTARGEPMPITDSGLDRKKISWYVASDSTNFEGRMKMQMFYDVLGADKAIDDSLICGYQMKYSDDGKTMYRYALDKYGKVVNATCNVEIIRLSGDTFDLSFAYVRNVDDTQIIPVLSEKGFHRMVRVSNMEYYYMPNQEEVSMSCAISRDMYGNIIQKKMQGNIPKDKPAIINYKYYENTGFLLSEENLDEYGNPFTAEDGIYLTEWDYTPDGRISSMQKYGKGKELVYAIKTTTYGDDVKKIEKFDAKDTIRTTTIRMDTVLPNYSSTSFYSKDMTPINEQRSELQLPYHSKKVMESLENGNKKRTTYYYMYDEEQHALCKQKTIIDEYGTVLSYYAKEEIFDKDENVLSDRIYDDNDQIVKSMMYAYKNGQKVARAVMGIEGTPVRCPKWEEEGFAYYKINMLTDFMYKYVSVDSENEWGERSVFYDALEDSYKQVEYKDFKGWYMRKERDKKESESYSIHNSYKQFVFIDDKSITSIEIPYIHILNKNSSLYSNGEGLKDGDRVVRIGQWHFKQSNDLFASEWSKMGRTQLPIEVLRPTKEGLKKLSTFYLQNDGMAEYHMLALTEKEYQQVKSSLKNNSR